MAQLIVAQNTFVGSHALYSYGDDVKTALARLEPTFPSYSVAPGYAAECIRFSHF